MEKRRKSRHLHSYAATLFWFSLSSEKRKRADEKGMTVVCKYKGREGKRRGRDGEKTGICTPPQPLSFGSSLSSAKRTCAYLGTEKKRQKQWKNSILLWFFLFPWKKNVCIFIHIQHGDAYVQAWGWKKETKRRRKGGYLPFVLLFPL